MSLVITAASSLLILRSVEAILIAQWAQWSAKCEITVPVCIVEGACTRTSGIRGYCTDLLKCQDFWSVNCILKELYCVSEAPLDVLKVDLWFNVGDFKFPWRAVVLLVLECDGACTGLNVHSARKSAVLVLVCCYKARSDREQELWGYWLPKGCIKQWCDEPSGYGCLSKKCEQGEHEAVTLLYLVTWPSCPTYRPKTQGSKHYVSHHRPVSAVTQQLGLCFLYCFSGLSPLLLLTYAVACKFWSCHELDCVECHPHTGFHYSRLLIYLCHDYSRIINISDINFGGSEYRQVPNFNPD